MLGLLTGLRIGEILGIRVGDVDLTGRLLYVRRDVYRGHVQDVPKTKHSERGIPLAAILVAAIQQWLEIRPGGSDWLFPSKAGTPHHDRNLLRREVWPVDDRLDVPRFGWHSLRHYAGFRTMPGTSASRVQTPRK